MHNLLPGANLIIDPKINRILCHISPSIIRSSPSYNFDDWCQILKTGKYIGIQDGNYSLGLFFIEDTINFINIINNDGIYDCGQFVSIQKRDLTNSRLRNYYVFNRLDGTLGYTELKQYDLKVLQPSLKSNHSSFNPAII